MAETSLARQRTSYGTQQKNERLVWNVDGNMTEQCLAAHIVGFCQQYCSANVVILDSDSTISLNIVDNYKQCWQKVIVQSC